MAKALHEALSNGGERMIPFAHSGVALGGFMGSGKSTVGVRLAHRLGFEFVDMDEELTRLFGPISRQFTEDGERMFRAREKEWLSSFEPKSPVVLATGGGVWCTTWCRPLLQHRYFCVSLSVTWTAATKRIGTGEERPLWTANSRDLYEQRKIQYRWGDVLVDTDTRTPDEVVQEIIRCM